MLNYKDINYKSNINNNKSYKQFFTKQGKKIIKEKEEISDKIDITLINNHSMNSMNIKSKKQNFFKDKSFKENFESNIHKKNNKLYYFPKLNNVNDNISDYEKRIENADSLINNANNLLNDTSMTDVKNTYSDELETYKELNDEFNKNTTSYLSKGNKNKNIYVNSWSNNKDATFKGLYNDNLDNPSMNIIQSSNYDDCKNTALLTGKKYFGLLNTNKDTNIALCATSDTLDKTSQRGYFKESCAPSNNDGFMYGGPWANAIYKTKGGIVNQDDYIGCYKDKQDGSDILTRAMFPASWKVTWLSDLLKIFGYLGDTNIEKTPETDQSMIDKLVLSPVYFAGNSGDAPWGVDFIDPNAQWIWYTKEAQYDAPINENKAELIFGIYENPINYYVTGKVYCCCDNSCIIHINNQKNSDGTDHLIYVNGWSNADKGYTGYEIQFNPGNNYIEILVTNMGGPAGVMLSVLNENNEVMFRTTTNLNNTSDITDGKCTWLYSSKLTKVPVPLTNEFSVESCAKYADLIGFPYIGLQYIQNNEGGTAQCFVTNSLENGTRYGSLGGSLEYNNKTYGIGPANAVYEMNNTADPSLIGSIGYIDENNQLLKYPDSMISYGDTYTEIKGYFSNPDIYYKGTLDECKDHCNKTNNCNGFSYFPSQQLGYLSKTDKVFGYRNMNENLTLNKDANLYMRDPKINNNESCTKSMNPITSDDWSNYLKNNSNDIVSEMTPDTKCGLYKTNEEIKQELDKANEELIKKSEKIVSNTTDIMNVNTKLNSQIGEDHNIIKDGSKLYSDIDDTTSDMSNTNNLNNILNNSNLVIKQSQYYYIIWIVLIILIIIGVIIMLRRI